MMTWSAQRAEHGNIVVTAPNRVAFLKDVADRFSDGRGFSVATINLDHVVKLDQDADFAQAYAAHSHVTADGNPIVWFSKLAGQSDVQLIPGSELIEPVAELANTHGVKVALFGSTDESLKEAADALKVRHPGLNVVLCLSPAMGFDPKGPMADDAIAQIKASGARMVFLALGAPKQEVFAARAQIALPATGFMSIGAGLDFVSGAQTRAPKLVQRLALEWVWRLAGNPKRLAGRYAGCIAILPKLTVRALRARNS